jgi:hypothetical protein
MTYLPAALIGGSISMTGILMGNMAIWKMMDAYGDSFSETKEMFSTIQSAQPVNTRFEAGKWYRATQPNGLFIKRLRIGQVLTVVGIVVTGLLAI